MFFLIPAAALGLASAAAMAFSFTKKSLISLPALMTGAGGSTTSPAPTVKTASTGTAATPIAMKALADSMVSKYRLNVDPNMIVAMMFIESGFNPRATRFEAHINDKSVGLMQTLVKTARDMWDKGYKAFPPPDEATLLRPEVSCYFGAAYVAWLKDYHRKRYGKPASEQWIVMSYNGGPSANNAQTRNHWAKYQAARKRFG